MASSIAQSRARFKRKVKALKLSAVPAAREAMLKGAKEVTDLQRSLVPKKTGRLAQSINFGEGDAPKTKATGAIRPPKSKPYDPAQSVKVSIWAGDDDAYYARWVEFGTKPGVKGQRENDGLGGHVLRHLGRKGRKVRRTHPGTKAEPYFFPAWRAKKKSVKSGISRAANKAIKKAAQTP